MYYYRKILFASDGSSIETGFDEWGYNYQARMFNGKYCDAYRDAAWCQDYKDDNLMMKWNDEFAIIQQIDNDSCAGLHGATYISPTGPGFGKF